MTDPLFKQIDRYTDPKLRPFAGSTVITLQLTGMYKDEGDVFEAMDELLREYSPNELEELGYADIESDAWYDDGTDY